MSVLTLLSLWLANPSWAHDGNHELQWNDGASYGSPVQNGAKRWEAQGVAAGGKLYVFGGYNTSAHANCPSGATNSICAVKSSFVYNPATDSWRRIADLPEALTHAVTVVDGNTIWLVGGFVGDHPALATDHVWKYDIATNTYTQGPALPAARSAGGGTILGRTIHYFGGVEDQDAQMPANNKADHWTLDLSAVDPQWVPKADLPNPRNHIGGAALRGKVYAVGGRIGGDTPGNTGEQKEVDVYDPATNSWSDAAAADLPNPRGHNMASTFVMNDHILSVGGTSPTATSCCPPTDEVTAYNPDANSWEQLTSLPAPRSSPVADTVGADKIVSSTGNGGGSTPTGQTFVGTLTSVTPPPSDRDGDGVPDASDKCPDVAGENPDGCPAPPQDTTDPTIKPLRPAPGSKVRDRTPRVSAVVRDNKGLTKSDIKLYVDGKRKVAFTYASDTGKLSYVSNRLSYGAHTVRIAATDEAGNRVAEGWSFKVVKRR